MPRPPAASLFTCGGESAGGGGGEAPTPQRRYTGYQDSIEVTGTYKQRKVELVKEGFNPLIIKDPLYILDESNKIYKPMTQQIYNAILEKTLKL